MAESSIEWTDFTWNPIRARDAAGKVGWHCEKVSPACEHCYAATFNGRRLPNGGTGLPYTRSSRDKVETFVDLKTLMQPLKWRKPRKVFVCSMTDLFGDFVTDEQIQLVFGLMSSCGQHTFQVLTKRPERAVEFFEHNTLGDCQAEFVLRTDAEEWRTPARCLDRMRDTSAINGTGCNEWPLPNVWLGTTVENQEWADKRIPHLLKCPAAVRFLSVEPMLGPVDLSVPFDLFPLDGGWGRGTSQWGIHWTICGGESGRNARPMHPDWARSLRDQCAAAGVPFFFKQWGEHCPVRDWICREKRGNRFVWNAQLQNGTETRSEPDHVWHYTEADNDNEFAAYRVGKKAAGRLLDGREHSEFPAAPEPAV